MAANVPVLVKVLDESTKIGMESAISNYGEALSGDEKKHLSSLTKDEAVELLKNLIAANRSMNRLLFIDTNNNNNQ